MKRLFSLFLVCVVFMSGCARNDMSVIELDYVPSQWIVRDIYESGEALDSVQMVKPVLDACSGVATTELTGELTVFDSFVATRKPMTSYLENYTFKMVTYAKGKENYVLCHDDRSMHLMAETIEVIPEFVDLENGSVMNRIPTILVPDEAIEQEIFSRNDTFNESGEVIQPVAGTLVQVSAALYGELEMTLGGRATSFPISTFEPFNSKMGNVSLAVGYSEETKRAYSLVAFGQDFFVTQPFSIFDEEQQMDEPLTFEDLSIKRVVNDGTLQPDLRTPVYEFTYKKDGQRVTEELALTFREGEYLGEKENVSPEAVGWSPYQDDGPYIYLHTKTFDGENPLSYPDVLRAAGTEMDELLEAINASQPVNRSGEQGAYHLLTLIDGWKGQTFDVTYKQRSKKVDIYLTDALRDQTFKLTSEGAETFLSYFPDLIE